jgi:hypothetical protein
MKELLLSIISSLAFSGLLTGALVFLAKSWISQRLKSAIEHEYAEKLEYYKTCLKTEHDLALERLKTSNAQNQAIQAAATASFTATHTMAQEKRLQTLETFWKATTQLRAKSAEALLPLFDIVIVLPDQSDHLLTNPNVSPTLKELTTERVIKDFSAPSEEVNNARLYADDYLFALFSAYRVITGRVAFQLLEWRKKGKIEDWAADSGIRRLLRNVLSAQEMENFDKLKVNRLNWLHNQIEQKILSHSAKIISGEASGELGLGQARRIAEAAAELDRAKPGLDAN